MYFNGARFSVYANTLSSRLSKQDMKRLIGDSIAALARWGVIKNFDCIVIHSLSLIFAFIFNITSKRTSTSPILIMAAKKRLEHAPITHFLCVPLSTSKTRPQLQSFLDRMRNIKGAAAIPHSAWSTVDTLRIPLGGICVPSSEKLSTICEGLKEFNVPAILGAKPGDRPSVTLKGLRSHKSGLQRPFVSKLVTGITNPQPWIILRAYLEAFFKIHGLAFGVSHLRGVAAGGLLKEEDSTNQQVVVLNTKSHFMTDEPFRIGKTFSPNRKKKPMFDIREMYATDGETLWLENLPVESMCLQETNGYRDLVKDGEVIGQGFENIFRVSLSDPAESGYEQKEPDIEYVTPSKREPIKFPLIISSDPQARAVFDREFEAAYKEKVVDRLKPPTKKKVVDRLKPPPKKEVVDRLKASTKKKVVDRLKASKKKEAVDLQKPSTQKLEDLRDSLKRAGEKKVVDPSTP